MKKLIVIGLTALVTLFVTIGVAPSASAYPEGVCDLELSAQVVNAGDEITATCSYSIGETDARIAAASDTTWVMTFNGETRTGTGATFTQTFQAPVVDEKTTFPLTSVGSNDAGDCSRTVEVTVLPDGTTVLPPGEELPNTGGPRLALLFAGLGLVLAGGVAIRQSRKGHDVPGA